MMQANYVLEMKYPTQCWQARWREAIPLGDGILGASVYGSVWDETILISHTDLWWHSQTPALPDVSGIVPQIRKCLLENRPMEASTMMQKALHEKGYNPEIGCPLPLCDLKIKMDTGVGFQDYHRILNLQTAEAEVSWSDGDNRFVRRCFVSYDQNRLVLEIREEHGAPFGCELWLQAHEPEDAQRIYQPEDTLLPKKRCNWADPVGRLGYSARNDDQTYFGAGACVRTEGGLVQEKKGRLVLSDVTAVVLVLQTRIRTESAEALQILSEQIKADDSYETMRASHIQAWKPRFLSAQLMLGKQKDEHCNEELLLDAYRGKASLELLEKMWSFGRYLLLASSREGGNPCSLYGLWCGEYVGTWAFNMVNENLQMIYWQALSGNMPELLLPVFDYVDRLMDDFRLNARNLYGCRGIFVPGPTVPDSGLVKHVVPHILYWTGGAGWLGQHYYDYYLCTKDENFLKNRALPYLREVALFYEDFLIEDKNGNYLSVPSNSPENSPGNFWDGKNGMGEVMETTMNATMDFAIAKEVLTHLIEGSTRCGLYEEERPKWQRMLQKIPPYEINEDGAIREWMHPFFKDNYRHRHQSHLYPLFPGNEIHKESAPELYQAFVTAAEKRLEIGINQQTGWSLAHLANNYARMEQPERALECLDLMCRACVLENLMTVHNDWRQMGIGVRMPWSPVQLDANMGLTAAINEMLMQSYDQTIRILPALPKRLRTGTVKHLLSRQGILVSITWDQERPYAEVCLENRHEPTELTLILPEHMCCDAFCGSCGKIRLENGFRKLELRKDAENNETEQT